MGYGPEDKLSIVSLNSQRRGLQSLSSADRPSYYRELFEKAEPGICFLPGDDKRAKLMAISGYEQYLLPNNDNTVLLYDNQKVEMKQPKVNLNSLVGGLNGLDLNQMVVPDVTVSTQKPYQKVVKEFNMISWKYDYLQNFSSSDGSLEDVVEKLIMFSQRLGLTTNKPVLIGGELNIRYSELTRIVKKLSKDGDATFLSDMQPIMTEMGYLQSMTRSSLKDTRHLYMMEAIKCSNSGSNGIVKTWEASQSSQVVADCFIASKQLKLADATLMDMKSVIGRKVCVPLETHRPTQTHIHIPPSPPKHHGG